LKERPNLEEDPIKKPSDAIKEELNEAKRILSEKRAKERESKMAS